MAKLKDTLVSGSLRATDTIYTTTVQAQIIQALISSDGTTYGPGSNGQVLKSNGTSVYWGTDNNTWRGIQDNLTSSTNTTESLSAKQGYLLANGSARDNTKLPLSGGTITGDMADLNGLLKLIDSTTTARTWSYAISCLRPSMSQGEHVWLPIGKSLSTGNCGGIAFDYDDDNSNNNAVGIEIFGNRVATFNNYGNLTLKRPLGILYGGTGATTADGACENLGAVKKSGGTMTGTLALKGSSTSIEFKDASGVTKDSYSSNRDYNIAFITEKHLEDDNLDWFYLPTPAATGSHNTYYILTTKSAVTVAQGGTGATTADGACGNIGAVKKSGDTMTGNLTIQTSHDPATMYRRADGTLRGYTLVNDDNRYIVIQKHLNDDNLDLYYFPIVNSGSSAGYDVLTTKSTVTIAQGGTGATTAAGACTNIGAVKKSGDTMTGNLFINTPDDNNRHYLGVDSPAGNIFFYIGASSSGTRGIWVNTGNTGKNVLRVDSNNDVILYGHASSDLPLTGGTLTGALGFANNTWNPVGDDVYIGDCNMGGCLGIKGQNGSSGLMFYAQDGNSWAKMYFDGTNFVSTNPIILSYNNSTKLRLWTDNEGGNIMIVSPDGHEYQFDAYNNDQLRLFAYDNSNNLHSLVWSRADGSLFVDRVYFGDALSTRESLHIYYRSATSDIASPSVGDICLVPV